MTTEVKHTPGPWRIGGPENKGAEGNILGPSNTRQKGDITHAICVMYAPHSPFKDEDKANARLIAAAPDLLVNLEQLIRVFKFHLGGVDKVLVSAEVIVGKAKGEVVKEPTIPVESMIPIHARCSPLTDPLTAEEIVDAGTPTPFTERRRGLKGRTEVDLRLLNEVPELLEAVGDVITDLEYYSKQAPNSCRPDRMQRVKDALAKVRGKTA